jgi:hypothetical protein
MLRTTENVYIRILQESGNVNGCDPTMNANRDPEIRKKKLHRRIEVIDSEIRMLEERKIIMYHEILEMGG